MLWPFNRFRTSRTLTRGTIETIYGMIVARAREPLFYRDLAVPDTVNGRFDMILLHLWMVLQRLQEIGDPDFSQALFDHFCGDLDANLREMGVGDLTVPKRMQKFGEAFYGRSAAYTEALSAGREALAQSLCKNIFNGQNINGAHRLADYAERVIGALASIDQVRLRSGDWRFAPIDAVASKQAVSSHARCSQIIAR